MALFESYERRIDQINAVLAKHGISSIEECKEICDLARVWTRQDRTEKHSLSASKTLSGLTPLARPSR